MAKDTSSSLDQRIARSSSADAAITVSTDNNFTAENSTHTDSLTDGQYVLIANNDINNSPAATQKTEMLGEYGVFADGIRSSDNTVSGIDMNNSTSYDFSWTAQENGGFNRLGTQFETTGPVTVTLKIHNVAKATNYETSASFAASPSNEYYFDLPSDVLFDQGDVLQFDFSIDNPANIIWKASALAAGFEDAFIWSPDMSSTPNQASVKLYTKNKESSYLRLTREWKVTNNGYTLPVNLKLDGVNSSWRLLGSRDGDFSNAFVIGSFDADGTISTPLRDGLHFTAALESLEYIGLVADDSTSAALIDYQGLNAIPGVSGARQEFNTAYQTYIDNNPTLFSAPATAAEVQAAVNTVNSTEVLSKIGSEADSPNSITSTTTTEQLALILPTVNNIVTLNEPHYQTFIDAHSDQFSTPATQAEVQSMITSVNVLAQVGADADNAGSTTVTVAQLQSITPALTGLVVENETAYQAYIDANPDAFSSSATVAELQAMINSTNVLVQVGADADAGSSTVTVTQLQTVSPALTGLVAGNEAAYQAYIGANPNAFSAPATAAELQAMVNAVNASQDILTQVGTDADAGSTTVTVAQLQTVSPALTDLVTGNEAAYQAYIGANPNAFSSPATAAELQAMVNTVNASQGVLTQVGTDADAGSTTVTVAQLQTVSPALTDLVAGNEAAYQAYIGANPNAFSSPAT
ncbi:hypothetical protein H4F17_18760, partial [Vibrio cholerae]